MAAVAKLAAVLQKFPRPERIVADVQSRSQLMSWMYAGFPIMCHLDSVKEFVNMEHIQLALVLWDPSHELGHHQLWGSWEFPTHTHNTEATWNLCSVYVHEKVLGIPRQRAHEELHLRSQRERTIWILFSDDQKMSNISTDSPSKTNLWAENFSQQMKKNLAPFFSTWGWSIKVEVSKKLESLPKWDKNPVKKIDLVLRNISCNVVKIFESFMFAII
uniref:Peptidase M60 domain-containing protein n=1 Tax=Gopherus agassizii TaxID=38772 RepID=A0A452GEW7_9SAUR